MVSQVSRNEGFVIKFAVIPYHTYSQFRRQQLRFVILDTLWEELFGGNDR